MGFNRKKDMGERPDYKCGEPQYTSGKESNPHKKGKRISYKHYSDHGIGSHYGEQDAEEQTSERKIW